MGNWRKYQGETHYWVDRQGRRPCYRKPPLDNEHSYVPSWEKKFCSSVGSVSWRKLLEAKRYMYLHDKVIQWDDSACKEAFDNAKSRFWAEINGLAGKISLPDPNIYIDNVDWDSNVDPELLLDLENALKAPITEVAMILSDTLHMNQSIVPTGWEDAEGDLSNCKRNPHAVDSVNQWEEYCIQKNDIRKEYEWENGWDGRNQWEDRPNADGSWRTWHGYRKKKERVDSHVLQNQNSSLPIDVYQRNRGWRNSRGRKTVNFGHLMPKPYLQQSR